MSTSFTKFLRLAIPDFLTSPWSTQLTDAFTALDAAVYNSLVAANVIPWANNTVYGVGNTRIDPVTGSIWLCLVAHTSALSPTTMATDRTNHPTYWTSVALSMRTRGAWANSTHYFVNDLVYDMTHGILAICIVDHTSTAPVSDITGEAANWTYIFNAIASANTAISISYDHTASSLVATTVQAAIDELVVNLTAGLALKAPLASPALTGNPTAPTATVGDNDTSIATTQFVQTAIAAVRNGVAANLDTLVEIAASINNDAAFSTTMNTALALKAPLVSPVFTGNPTGPTASPGDNDTSLATTAFVTAAVAAVGSSTGLMITETFYNSTQTVTIPALAVRADIELWGASGGGASGANTGGGGAGGTVLKLLTGLTPGNTLALTVGAAGTLAGTGGNSTLASGTQAITTLTGSGGVGASGRNGGAGGTATNGDLNITGQSGASSTDQASGALPCTTFAAVLGTGGSTRNSNGGNGNAVGIKGGMIIKWYT